MQKHFLTIGLGLGLSLSGLPSALAVQPAPIQSDAKVQWSQVIKDPFDGLVVYDKNFNPANYGYNIVSSWSMSGIRLTYTRYNSDIVGYNSVWKTRWVHRKKGKGYEERYLAQEPIYRHTRIDRTPDAIQIAIKDTVYTYNQGPVTPELAAALASAPPENVRIRLVWDNGETLNTEIGKGTVEAWKAVFRQSVPSPAVEAQPKQPPSP